MSMYGDMSTGQILSTSTLSDYAHSSVKSNAYVFNL